LDTIDPLSQWLQKVAFTSNKQSWDCQCSTAGVVNTGTPTAGPLRRLTKSNRRFIVDVTARFDISEVSGVRCQFSAQPLAAGAASLIKKETNEHRTSNAQHRTSN
jgi:hypothetical protein